VWAESTIVKTKARLEKDIFPFIGNMNIDTIEAPDLLSVIKRIEGRSPDTAKRALQECGQIFRYGIALGKNKQNPSQALQGLLLPTKQKHFAAITDPIKAGELLRAIDNIPDTTLVVKSAFKLAPLFFVRIGELRKAKWSEIDFEKREWRYFVTKTKQDHIVPLPKQAIAILRELQQLTGRYEHVFIGYRNPNIPMSDGALNAAIRRLGYNTQEEMTGHGFRAMARTILHEGMGFEKDVIEHQLAHAVGDNLGTAYNRTKFLEQRTKMMQQWADYLDGLKVNVVQFPKHKRA
jgi:integrase